MSSRIDASLETNSYKNIMDIMERKYDEKETFACIKQKQQSTYSEKKYDNISCIPKDIYMDINKYLQLPKLKENLPQKVTNKRDTVQTINGNYTKDMFVLEEKIFIFPKNIISMVETSFKMSFISHKLKKRFCFFCSEYISNNLQKFYDHIRCPKHVNYFKEMTKDKEWFTLAKESITKISDDHLHCHWCNVRLDNNQRTVKEHAKNKTHKRISSVSRKYSNDQFDYLLKEFENCWYNIQMYGCILCNKIFQYKFNFLQHLVVVHKNEKDIMYDFCLPCATLWAVYNNKLVYSYSIHCSHVMHKYLVNSLHFIIREMPKHVKDMLHHVDKISEKLYKLSEGVFKNDLKQLQLLQSLKYSLRSEFPAAVAYPFGSRLTGLGFPSSDIDIFLDCNGDGYEKDDLLPSVDKYLEIAKDCLSKDQDNWVVQNILKQSRTPIIKLRHRLTGLQCDVSFTNGLSVENTKLLRSFNKACLPCRKLILFLKKWLSCCSLPGLYSITNYALAWLVIFYLQRNEGLPGIDTLIKQKNESRFISGWETGANFEIPTVSIDKSFTNLLIGFFDFYSDFDYKNHVVCPLVADVVRKQDFIKPNLPNAMKPYITYLEKSHNEGMFRIDSSMCIQDPFDLSHNLTKAVQPLTLKAFKLYCRDSANIVRVISKH